MLSSPSMAIAFFDVDHTLVRGSTAFHCAGVLRREGVLSRWLLLRVAWAHLRHRLGILNFEEVYARGVGPFVGLDAEATLAWLREGFETCVRPNLYIEGIALVERHHRAGDRVVLLSASSVYLLEMFKEVLPVSEVVGFRQHIRDGRLVADFDRPIPYGSNKLPIAQEVARRAGIPLAECSFYTDNSADLPLLRAVGRPVAVNPNWRLRLEALLRGWPVMRFREVVGGSKGLKG